ncbi:hypothetical protein B7463_g7424, partial [Scytalidium lignicola]
MSDLFKTLNEVTQDDYDTYTWSLENSVTPVPWRGFHSYTLRSNSGLIIQFRSKESPLSSMTKFAKQVHGHLVPATTYHSLMLNSSVSVWVMEIMAGVGYAFTTCTITPAKLDITVVDFAKFYTASWKSPQSSAKDEINLYNNKLKQLTTPLPPRFTKIIENTQKNMSQTIDLVPWVLTHQDLSNATIEPFGMAPLWGGPNGWSYFEGDPSRSRALFWETLLREIECIISEECLYAINEIRTPEVLLRYGFFWENGTMNSVKDTTFLDAFLKDELTLAEKSSIDWPGIWSQAVASN